MELISREQAIDAIRDMQAFEDDNGQPYLYLYDVMAVFTDEEELPTIQPKRGKWLPVTNGRSGHECDQCHEYAPCYQTGEEHLSDFCPNCGADMRGEQDG